MSEHKTAEELEALWDEFERPKDEQHFRHYKGGEYGIVTTGFLENGEIPCVIYRSLENDNTWVRTAEDFLSSVEYEGTTQPRFRPI
jgi:hypothetical protein